MLLKIDPVIRAGLVNIGILLVFVALVFGNAPEMLVRFAFVAGVTLFVVAALSAPGRHSPPSSRPVVIVAGVITAAILIPLTGLPALLILPIVVAGVAMLATLRRVGPPDPW
jgi:hypothetical protein